MEVRHSHRSGCCSHNRNNTVVTPGRIPPAVIPTPKRPTNKNDGIAMIMPPIMTRMVTITPVFLVIMFCVIPPRCFALPVTQPLFCLRVESLPLGGILSRPSPAGPGCTLCSCASALLGAGFTRKANARLITGNVVSSRPIWRPCKLLGSGSILRSRARTCPPVELRGA